MGNPLNFVARPWAQHPQRSARRRVVPVPDDTPSTDAIFLALRRMRTPILTIIGIFTISVLGLVLIPGVDENGHPYRMTPFDAFYFISYTATTIGFGETPHAFTIPQRMWVTLSIYASVVGWAYGIGAAFSLIQNEAFQDALRTQRFARRVRRLREPFWILAGYGQTGTRVARELDNEDVRFVVIDHDGARIDELGDGHMVEDVPGIEGDAGRPGILGLSGLNHPYCAGVLALTDDDHTNLAIVMSANLLRPEVPVYARCQEQRIEAKMHCFGADGVVNPNDRFGGYLVLSLQRPVTHQMVTWLMSPPGTPLPQRRREPASGRWVVIAEGQFGREVAHDLQVAGVQVDRVLPEAGMPDVSDAEGLVAGLERDTSNLAIAEQARLANPDIDLVVRQAYVDSTPLVRALDVGTVFMATDVVAREVLARIVTPVFRTFVDRAVEQPDEWSATLLERIIEVCGDRNPEREVVHLSAGTAPAAHRWLAAGHTLTLRDLFRHADDRDERLQAMALALFRDGEMVLVPDESTPLRVDDELLVVGRQRALGEMEPILDYDATVEYAATGHKVPTGALWRALSGHRRP